MAAGPHADEAADAAAEARAGGAPWFWLLLGGLALFLVAMADLTPVVLDDWYQLAWYRKHELTATNVFEYARYNYFHFNPRLGETLLLLLNGPKPINLIVTPTLGLLLLLATYALGAGRWPRASATDARALLMIQALLFATAPAPGLLWFYRPFTTNYLFGFVLHLLVLLPYRFALTRPEAPRGWWAPALALGGLAAGMCNEHTGPATIAAMAVLSALLWRRGQRRLFVPVGLLAMIAGYAALYFAPGQSERYGATGATKSRLASIAERGLDGTYDVFVRVLLHTQLGLWLGLLALGVAMARARRRGEAPALPGRESTLAIAGLVVWAGAITATLLFSPLVGERLFFAQAVLLVVAMMLLLAPQLRDRAFAHGVTVAAALVLALHVGQLLRVQVRAHADGERRMALLAAAPADGVAVVPAYHHYRRSRWFWGDDFRFASLREYVAQDVFGLAGIELAGPPAWAEPALPLSLEVDYHYQPPLAREALAARVPLPRRTPSSWQWVIEQQRRLLPKLLKVDGHELRRITVRVVGLGEPVPSLVGSRPLYADTWDAGGWRFVRSYLRWDDAGWPLFAFAPTTLPPDLQEAWVVGCGEATPVTIAPDRLEVPFQPACDGFHAAILCTPTVCWLGGSYSGSTAPSAQRPAVQKATPATMERPGRNR